MKENKSQVWKECERREGGKKEVVKYDGSCRRVGGNRAACKARERCLERLRKENGR